MRKFYIGHTAYEWITPAANRINVSRMYTESSCGTDANVIIKARHTTGEVCEEQLCFRVRCVRLGAGEDAWCGVRTSLQRSAHSPRPFPEVTMASSVLVS